MGRHGRLRDTETRTQLQPSLPTSSIMKEFMVLVFVVFTICSSICTALPTESTQTCTYISEAWASCSRDVPRYVNAIGDTFPISLDLDQLCVDMQPFHNCFGLKLTQCPQMRSMPDGGSFIFINRMLSYFCTDEGKYLLTDALHSPCNDNETVVGSIMVSCRPSFDPGMTAGQICKGIKEEHSCVASGVRLTCGKHAGRLAERIYGLMETTPGVLTDAQGNDCFPDPAQGQLPQASLISLIARGLKMMERR